MVTSSPSPNQDVTPITVGEADAFWQRLVDLLQAKEYERVAKGLREIANADFSNPDPNLVTILAMARQICLAGQQYCNEIDTHQRHYEDAVMRERVLRKQLVAILETAVLSDHNLADENQLLHPQSTPKPLNFKERIRAWFGFDLHQNEPIPIVDAGGLESLLSPFVKENGQATRTPAFLDVPTEPIPIKPFTLAAEDSQPKKQLKDDSFTKPKVNGRHGKQAIGDISEQPSAAQPLAKPEDKRPSLIVYCLGAFQVYEDDHPITEWNSRKGKSIFKYLIMNRQNPVAKEQLMTIFWPESNEDAARNNLNVAIYGLRKALRNGYPNFSHILFEDDHYQFHPELQIWVDIEQFDKQIDLAKKFEAKAAPDEAMQHYYAAEALYQGALFENGRFEEWMQAHQQATQDNILFILAWLSSYYFEQADYFNCININRKTLTIESCQESAHQQLMRCYALQHQHNLAIRQYHQCVAVLENELDVEPSPQTIQLYEKIRNHELI